MFNNIKPGLVVNSILSFLGIVLAAVLSFHYGQVTAREKMLQDQKASAYVQYVEASALYKQLAHIDNEIQMEAAKQRGLRNAARFRITIYGSKNVLEGLADNMKAIDESNEEKEATIKWFQAMRNEITPKDEQVNDEVISELLWPSGTAL